MKKLIDFPKIKARKINFNDPKVIKIIKEAQKAIEETLEKSKNNIRFPFWK
jgi:hypothetical protein